MKKFPGTRTKKELQTIEKKRLRRQELKKFQNRHPLWKDNYAYSIGAKE